MIKLLVRFRNWLCENILDILNYNNPEIKARKYIIQALIEKDIDIKREYDYDTTLKSSFSLDEDNPEIYIISSKINRNKTKFSAMFYDNGKKNVLKFSPMQSYFLYKKMEFIYEQQCIISQKKLKNQQMESFHKFLDKLIES